MPAECFFFFSFTLGEAASWEGIENCPASFIWFIILIKKKEKKKKDSKNSVGVEALENIFSLAICSIWQEIMASFQINFTLLEVVQHREKMGKVICFRCRLV